MPGLFAKIRLRTKLTFFFLIVGLTPLAVTSVLAVRAGNASPEHANPFYEHMFVAGGITAALVVIFALVVANSFARPIAKASRTLTQSLTESTGRLAQISVQLSTHAEETSAQVHAVTESGVEVSGNMQAVATAVSQIGACIREISQSSAQASTVAANAVSQAEGTCHTVARLGESSKEIGKFIQLITSIAERTNLLALNAAIEAARAGDAGRGFAVVAQEVKELARQTAQASEEIRGKVSTIQTQTGEAVTSILAITEVIKEISDSQTSIAGAVEEQSVTMEEIARNVNAAATSTSEISASIRNVDTAASGTAHAASGTQETAATLTRITEELSKLAKRFECA